MTSWWATSPGSRTEWIDGFVPMRAAVAFAVPEGAPVRYRALIRDLEGLELDLHRHLHLENNVLFPRAVQMEKRAAQSAELEFHGTGH